jgi:SAM-dependent methyltransferase
VDISSLALQEARKRIGEHGLFVVADVANLPFKAGSFDGAVSLHTIHHLPAEEHPQAYAELARVLVDDGSAVVVNGWSDPPLMWIFKGLLKLAKKARQARALQRQGRQPAAQAAPRAAAVPDEKADSPQAAEQQRVRKLLDRQGTFVSKNNAAWLKRQVGQALPQGRRLEIWCWRSVSVEFLRTFVHQRLGGKGFLRLLYWKEERLPHFFGEFGQYPLVVITPKSKQVPRGGARIRSI